MTERPGTAFISVSGAGGAGFDGIFALELKALNARMPATNPAAVLVNSLWSPKEERVFELRVLWDQTLALTGRGGTRVFVVARVRKSTIQDARESAGRLADEVLCLLNGACPSQAWEYVIEESQLDAILHPFKVDDAAELTRRRDAVPVEGRSSENESESPYQDADPDSTLILYRPPEGRSDPLSVLSTALLCQKAPVMLSVAWAPTRPAKVELAAMRRDIGRCQLLLDRFETLNGARSVSGAASREAVQVLRSHLAETADALGDSAFLVKVVLASAAPLSESILRLVGETLFGVGASQGEAADVLVPFRSLRGGFDVRRCPDGGVPATARRLACLEFKSDAAIPSGVARRAIHLMPATQAARLFILPKARCPGIPDDPSSSSAIVVPETPTGTLIGHVAAFGSLSPVKLGDEDRARHAYLVGTTGSGKSSLMAAMALDDIRRGRGVTVLDPHGTLVKNIMGQIPSRRRKDVIFIDVGDRSAATALNLLEHSSEAERDFIVDYFLDVFREMYDMKECGGPMFETHFRAGLLLAMTGVEGTPTLGDVVHIFSKKEFRRGALKRCSLEYVRELWSDIIEETGGETSLANITSWIISKLNAFIYNPAIRKILCQPKSNIDFKEVIGGRKILLVDLNKAALGSGPSRFLGCLFAGQVLRAAMSPAAGDGTAAEHFVYVDEYHNLATATFATMLAESRKFGLRLTMADQFFGQLSHSMRDAVLGNVGSLLAFRLGPADADLLKDHFAPEFGAAELLRLPVGRAAASIQVAGMKAPPFILRCARIPTRGPDSPSGVAKSDDIPPTSKLDVRRIQDVVRDESR